MEFLWDDLKHKTTILPEKNKHYKAQHDKKYHINIVDKEQKIIPNTNTLVIKNTIKTSQLEMLNNKYDLLLHSDFTDEKRENDFEFLIKNYNKSSIINENKPNILGTHLIQASLDISFNNLIEDVLSPQFSIQRYGRCGRWGEYELCSITVVKQSPNVKNIKYLKSEAKIKEILYNKDLSDAWYDELVKYDKQTLNLDEIYQIFNDFNKKNSKEINIFIRNKFDESNKYLDSIYPIKFEKSEKTDEKTAGSNKLRSVNNEIFYIVQHEDGKSWVGPFSKEILNDFDTKFDEYSNITKDMFETMKKLCESNDKRFNFNSMLDNKKYTSLDSIRRMAKKSNTPYIVYNRYYDEKLGIVKKNKENKRKN
jgi:CRISPR/Cas system-associated endonuclease/helicase Cas3